MAWLLRPAYRVTDALLRPSLPRMRTEMVDFRTQQQVTQCHEYYLQHNGETRWEILLQISVYIIWGKWLNLSGPQSLQFYEQGNDNGPLQ